MTETEKFAPDAIGGEEEANKGMDSGSGVGEENSLNGAADLNEPQITLKPAGPLDPPGIHGRKTSPKRPFSGRNAVAYLAKVGVLAALATVLYLFARFPIFAAFPFNVLDMDFSDVPALIGGFALGPVGGVIIEFIKCVIKLSTSDTMFVGELSNFIVGTALVLPASLYYKYHKTMKGALISLLIGISVNAAVSVFNNYFITVPLYSVFAPVVMEVRVEFACYYGLGFNILKSTVASVITLLIYKRLSPILHI